MRLLPTRRMFAVTATFCAVTLAVAACGGTSKDDSDTASSSASKSASANPDAPLKKGLKIAFLPKQVNNNYFVSSDKGGEDAVKEFGGTFKRVGPSDAKAALQIPYINTLAQQGQDAICISADDADAVVPALTQARQRGVKIVTYDADAGVAGRDAFANQANAEDLGRSEVQLIAKQIGEKGKIAILSATANAANQNVWIGFMKDELKKFPGITLVKVAYGDDQAQKSFTETQGLLQAYPDLKGIISPTTVGIVAAARYLQGSKYKGKVALTGLGTPNDMRKYVKDGTVKQFELWDPAKLGYLCAYTAAALASGQITGAEGEKFKAGTLGEKTIGKDGTILLGPPTVFEAANIDQFNF
jgi:rhamnose transport system substrate-binding protein